MIHAIRHKRLVIALSVCVILGCVVKQKSNGRAPQQRILIKGSDTMLVLVQRWAEIYMSQNPGVAIYVEGGGSNLGIKALIKGNIDIAAASRSWRPDEIKAMVDEHGSLGVAILCARDALSIYLNRANPVRNLSLQQIKDIFTGKIHDWVEVGGVNEPIMVLNRNPNSGTYHFFEEHVLLGEVYTKQAETMPTTRAIARRVAEEHTAIGYGGMAYGSQIVQCNINGIEPTPENVRNGAYPISRYLYFYTVRPPAGQLKHFIDWVLSAEGQRVVREVRYIPLFEVE